MSSTINNLTPIYTWDSVEPRGADSLKPSVIEIAAAPIPSGGRDSMELVFDKNTFLFLNGELKSFGEGDPASNFRYKSDSELNNSAIKYIEKMMVSARNSGSRILFPSFPRDERYVTFKMEEDGDFTVSYSNGEDTWLRRLVIDSFLVSFGITREDIKRLRVPSKGAGFRTKLADVQSLLLEVDAVSGGDLMEEKVVSLDIRSPSSKDSDDGIELPNGKTWFPIKGNDYLYFKEPTGIPEEDFVVSVPKKGSIDTIYDSFWNALNSEENDIKKNIRSHFRGLKNYRRWSDYSVNDVDDAFTILTILNAYDFCELTEEDELIRTLFREIIKPWFDDLDSK
jgi:hypothetical protein